MTAGITKLSEVSAIRLELLPDEAHGTGVGRKKGGSVAISQVKLWRVDADGERTPILLGGAGWALGATTLTNAAAAVSGAMAKVGAFRLTMNLVEGASVGYMEGGMSGAVVGGMRRTLPINTMTRFAFGLPK